MRRPIPLAGLLRRFVRDDQGAYAVEFGLISGVFIATVVALLQFMLVFLARDSLDAALQAASRTVLTGSFQQANAGSKDQATILANLKALMCGGSTAPSAVIFNCADLKVDVNVASSFASSSSSSSAVDSNTGNWSPSFGTNYSCPSPSSIAVIRAAVRYPVLARALAFGLSDFADGSILLQAATVFRVEQYQSGSSSAC